MGKTISELIEKTSASNSDVLLIENGTSTNKITKANFLKEITQDLSYDNGNVEGDYITVNGSKEGSITNLELLGNTVQSSTNLADIQSVGTLQEDGRYKMSILSCGKNLFDEHQSIESYPLGLIQSAYYGKFFKMKPNTTYTIKSNSTSLLDGRWFVFNVCNSSKTILEVFNIKKNISGSSHSQFQTIQITTLDDGLLGVSCYVNNKEYWNELMNVGFQIEEGAVATTYEPYQGNKTSILLPCQLEKVGDVRDRLFRREDGIWCIEKNIGNKVLNGSENWLQDAKNETINSFLLQNLDCKLGLDCMSNRLPYPKSDYTLNKEGVRTGGNNGDLLVYIANSKLTSQDVAGFKTWLQQNPTLVKYQLATPQIIELPLDVQIQLNSFNGVTNIFTEDTVISPTIKATVPKSLGASVQSLVNKTDILSDRVGKIENLQKGNEMIVSTNKKSVVVEDTNEGYITDFSIKGDTLVNLLPSNVVGEADSYSTLFTMPSLISKDKEYTLIPVGINILSATTLTISQSSSGTNSFVTNATQVNGVFKFKCTNQSFDYATQVRIRLNGLTVTSGVKYIILEGDFTDKDISYFEGLKSVGDGTDKIELISNSKGNMVNLGDITEGYYISKTNMKNAEPNSFYCNSLVEIDTNMEIYLRNTGTIQVGIYRYFDKDKNFISGEELNTNVKLNIPNNAKYLGISFYNRLNIKDTLYVGVADSKQDFDYKIHRKELLYKNVEGLYEKPVLRKVSNNIYDTIELHSDGKYYYHKRCNVVVLNGSETSWGVAGTPNQINSKVCSVVISDMTSLHYDKATIIGDKLKTVNITADYNSDDTEYICCSGSKIYMRLLNSKLYTQDVEGFKKWLASNNVTVVYQLATEEVYECTNINLNAYDDTTFISLESGFINPQFSAKVSKHIIGNVVNQIKEKTDNLEEKVEKLINERTIRHITSKGYMIAEDTTDSYVENVKVEGNTLVNLVQAKENELFGSSGSGKAFEIYRGDNEATYTTIANTTNQYITIRTKAHTLVKPNTTYTLIFEILENTLPNYQGFAIRPVEDSFFGSYSNNLLYDASYDLSKGTKILKFTTGSDTNSYTGLGIGFPAILTGTAQGLVFKIANVNLLEGDHTNKPPSYFEGLLSTGQDVEVMEITSTTKNLCSNNFKYGLIVTGEIVEGNTNRYCSVDYMKVRKGMTLITSMNGVTKDINYHKYDNNKKFIGSNYYLDGKMECDFNGYVRIHGICTDNADLTTLKVQVEVGENTTNYELHKQDTKQLLYKNSEGEFVPIMALRRINDSIKDTIELHSDGKYYYHKRCNEVVLNGSENWAEGINTSSTTKWFYVPYSNCIGNSLKVQWIASNMECDYSSNLLARYNKGENFTAIGLNGANNFEVVISQSKLPSQNVAGFKTWLSQNPTTVVYQLATEEVFECVNLDLDSYEGETSVIFDGGAISPKLSFKIASHIANTIQVLKDRISYLEGKVMDMFKAVLCGDVQTLAYELYPEDFKETIEETTEIIEN